MQRRSITVPTLVLTASLALAACGGGHGSHSSSSDGTDTTASTAGISPDADFNPADVTFAQGMIPHHEQAIEMAEMALDPGAGAGEEVQRLATAIRGGQDPEIQLMKGWLAAWGQPEMGDMPGHDMAGMEGMMSADEMEALGSLTGAEFDTAWLRMMVEHHEGAVAMAQDVRAGGESTEVAALADRIIAAQTEEIDAMNALLGK